jgi:hypothetical protein
LKNDHDVFFSSQKTFFHNVCSITQNMSKIHVAIQTIKNRFSSAPAPAKDNVISLLKFDKPIITDIKTTY